MDLNQLLFDHQVALIRADELARAGGKPDRPEIAVLYERIRALRGRMGVWHNQFDHGVAA